MAAYVAGSVVVADHPEGLMEIHRPGVDLSIWRRAMPPSLREFIDKAVAPHDVKRIATYPSRDPNPTEVLRDLPTGTGRDLLQNDIGTLIRLYEMLSGVGPITLKLESFGGNLCERFHVDRVPLRLICSYAGPGTEWLAEEDIDRTRLGPAAGDLPDEQSGCSNREQVFAGWIDSPLPL